MKILMINKFLYPVGGAETYMIKLGKYLTEIGHEIQYFGMYDEKNIVGNNSNSYTTNMVLRGKSSLVKQIKSSLKVIYSLEARKKLKIILEEFKPDIVHMNNINFQLTPSIIYEIKKHNIPIIQTVHDSQIACPNHRLYIESKGIICDKCLDGKYINCLKEKCVQNSIAKSSLATIESYYYHFRDTYNLVDKYICPSSFIASILERGRVNKNKIKIMYNFSEEVINLQKKESEEDYVLYFGRLSKEKGVETLIKVCKKLPEVKFVFAGTGSLKKSLNGLKNVNYVGFKNGEELQRLISNALFTVYPSEWYENCPLSVIESQALGTPVVASNLGGTKELINNKENGILFEGMNKEDLEDSIKMLWNDRKLVNNMSNNCINNKNNNTIKNYAEQLLELYSKAIVEVNNND